MYDKIIISPHVDDDILGCGGILDEKSLVLYCGIDDFHVVSREERLLEAKAASKILNHSYTMLHGNKVNKYIMSDLIDDFSNFINKHKPKQVFIPYPSYNQDHQAVYEAALIALRPHDVNFFVKEVLVYEQPHVFFWDNSHSINSAFKPNYFIPIDVDKKIEAYKAMTSQNRSFRSAEHINSLALLRGGQSGCRFAEAFQAIRIVK
jgi:LmbE family N-acetylglucosaminyl deacetylase